MHRETFSSLLSMVNIVAVVLLAGTVCNAQRQVFQAQALGQGLLLGQNYNITIDIYEYSTPEDREILFEAFQEDGHRGLFNALYRMKVKGNVRITGNPGYKIVFVREIPSEGGQKIRVVTERPMPLRLGEAFHQGRRKSNIRVTVIEIDLYENEKENTGVLMPLVEFKVDEDTHDLVPTLFDIPWTLVNIQNRTKQH